MTFETSLICFGLLTMILISTEIIYTYATQGFGFGFSSNRAVVEKTPLGLRIERTYRNQIESAAYIVPAFVAGALTGANSSGLQTAALIVVLGRAVFSVLYLTGIPFARIIGFAMGSFGSLYIFFMLMIAV